MLKKFFHCKPTPTRTKWRVQPPFGSSLAKNEWGKPAAALSYYQFSSQDALSKQIKQTLSPEAIGHRLWTSHQSTHQLAMVPRTLATSTTVYDGKGNLITASSVHFCLFLAIYDEFGYAMQVHRLNPFLPSANQKTRETRLETIIHIHNLEQKLAGIRPESIGKTQIIYCDAQIKKWSIQNQEAYLLKLLRMNDPIGITSETRLAQKMTEDLMQDMVIHNPKLDGLEDNVSFLIQTITRETPAFLMGLYRNQGRDLSSEFIAEQILYTFKQESILSAKAYAKQRFSVMTNQETYNQDNLYIGVHNLIRLFQMYQRNLKDPTIITAIQALLLHLHDDQIGYSKRAKKAYSLLINTFKDRKDISLVGYIKSRDSSTDAKNLLTNLVLITQNQFSGILPSKLIDPLIFLITGEHLESVQLKSLPFHLFSSLKLDVTTSSVLALGCE